MSAATITLIDRPDGGTEIRLATSDDEGSATRIATSLMEWLKKIAKDNHLDAPKAKSAPVVCLHCDDIGWICEHGIEESWEVQCPHCNRDASRPQP